MSYYILHITTPNVFLYCEKGFLFCRFKDGNENKIPIDDLRVLIVATHQVSFTNSCLARLMENDVVVLHCNNQYKPTGWSVGLDRVVKPKAFLNQIKQDVKLYTTLWEKVLYSKVMNQAGNLDLLGVKEHNLFNLIKQSAISEGNIAKQYWKQYFCALNVDIKRERRGAKEFENSCLNYGYAVISTLIYRSLLVHGLCPNLGIHHKEKYDSTPLVYDFVEPFRPFIDFYFYQFKKNFENKFMLKDHKIWCEYLAFCLKSYRLKIKTLTYKIIDYVDIYIECLTKSFLMLDAKDLIVPNIKEQQLDLSV